MTSPSTTDEFQQKVLEQLEHLSNDVSGLKTDVSGLKTDVSGLKTDVNSLKVEVSRLSGDVERSSDRFSNYQQATQWVVQLAFTLIASATLTVIITAVFKR
ncbi:MAG: hypothetical protein VKJ46_01580 [Leptolyngbyaceae bacterium]|nr:hypothetical protein [Leptolyngbyaceae bacterium]